MNREEKRLAKMAEWRAAQGLPPKVAEKPQPRKRRSFRTADSRTANHVDGYDRDDIGLSPDY